jgi:hypothetical protein
LRIAKGLDERDLLAELVAQGDRIQMADKRFRRQLSLWFHPNRSHSKDGIPGYACGYSDMMSMVGPLVIRTFDMGKGRAAKDKDLAEESPVLLEVNELRSKVKEVIKAEKEVYPQCLCVWDMEKK